MAEVVVRFARSTEVDAGTLAPYELARRDRLVVEADREAYEAAHALVRECAADLLGCEAKEIVLRQRCAACGSDEHGAPSIDGAYVSLSHTRGWVAAVAARARCGIDVEMVHRGAIPGGALTPREAVWAAEQEDPAYAFTRLWVRKEALVKAGHGDLASAGSLDVLDGEAPATRIGRIRLQEWSGDGAVGAVALA